jgi:hypothetical protein
MKQLLLLVAIYSLVIHQSHKNKIVTIKENTMSKAALLQVKSVKQANTQADKNYRFVSSINNKSTDKLRSSLYTE